MLSVTLEEYLATERQADAKTEFHDGEIFAITGASYQHNLIVANVIRELGNQLKSGPCAVLPSDLRVWIEASRRFVYPDITVVCGERKFAESDPEAIVNPTLLVEVLSDTTRNYDRGEKFEHYRALNSFAEYVLLTQDRPHCEHFVLQSNKSWIFTEASDLDAVIPLTAVGCELPLREVYDRVSFPRRGL